MAPDCFYEISKRKEIKEKTEKMVKRREKIKRVHLVRFHCGSLFSLNVTSSMLSIGEKRTKFLRFNRVVALIRGHGGLS
jgi:hypothetical protein